MYLPTRTFRQIALSIWCFCLAGYGSAVPLTDHAPEQIGSTPEVAPRANRRPDFPTNIPPLDPEAIPARPTTATLPSDVLIGREDRQRLHRTEQNASAFGSPERALNDIVLDSPASPLFSNDEALMERMRSVRDHVSPLLKDIDGSINRAGRELLESLGIEDTSTTRLLSAQARHEQSPPPWTARAAGRDTGSAPPWEEESVRNTLGKLLFLFWDTVTNPLVIAAIVLFASFRLMMALVRLSGRRHARRRRSSRGTPSAAPPTTQPPPRRRSRSRVR